jgi:hypothetical protein
MREPRVQTGKMTVVYMAVSLACIAVVAVVAGFLSAIGSPPR